MPEETFVKVKLTDSTYHTLQPGEVVALPEDKANELVERGFATLVEE